MQIDCVKLHMTRTPSPLTHHDRKRMRLEFLARRVARTAIIHVLPNEKTDKEFGKYVSIDMLLNELMRTEQAHRGELIEK